MSHNFFRSAALVAMTLVLVSPAFAAGGGDSKAKAPGAATANPEAAPINQRNPQVIHAGPGKPTVGAVHTPAGGSEKKSGGH
jgi:hypothetical protein